MKDKGNLPHRRKKEKTIPIYDRRRRQSRTEGRQASDPIYDLLSLDLGKKGRTLGLSAFSFSYERGGFPRRKR